MKVIFMGSPAFALPSLKALVHHRYRVAAVVTQPDRPRGRGRKLLPTPVKEYARRENLPCLEPANLGEPGFLKALEGLKPDLIATAAYGKILPPALLALPRLGCVNLHPSLLPLYRGAAPVQRALMEGARETGVTVYLMDEGMDSGDILLQEPAAIGEGETAGELLERLALQGAGTLLAALGLLAAGQARARPQDPEGATYAPSIRRDEEELDWSRGGEEAARHINGLSPQPGAHCFFRGRRLKLLRALPAEGSGPAGEVLEVSPGGIVAAAGRGALRILEVRPEGKNTMSAGDFLRGYCPLPGMTLKRCRAC